MSKIAGRISAALAVAVAMFMMAGCDKNREEYVYVPPPPPPPYKIVEDKGVKYAVLQEGSVISDNIKGWHALSPKLFAKLTGITIEAPAPDKTYHEGYNSYVLPTIESGSADPDNKMAKLPNSNTLVTKDLNGWAAVDQENLDAITKRYLESTVKK